VKTLSLVKGMHQYVHSSVTEDNFLEEGSIYVYHVQLFPTKPEHWNSYRTEWKSALDAGQCDSCVSMFVYSNRESSVIYGRASGVESSSRADLCKQHTSCIISRTFFKLSSVEGKIFFNWGDERCRTEIEPETIYLARHSYGSDGYELFVLLSHKKISELTPEQWRVCAYTYGGQDNGLGIGKIKTIC
jgi:hypothetical protein